MFNPAVTVAIYITEGTLFNDLQLILMIICFQIIGAYIGIIMGHFIVGEPAFLCPYESRFGCLRLGEEDYMKVFLLEFWCTFFFCMCILCQIFTRTQDSKDGVVQAGAIAVTLYAMI
jgi:glycerol uptake facilitator-like aquaporin